MRITKERKYESKPVKMAESSLPALFVVSFSRAFVICIVVAARAALGGFCKQSLPRAPIIAAAWMSVTDCGFTKNVVPNRTATSRRSAMPTLFAGDGERANHVPSQFLAADGLGGKRRSRSRPGPFSFVPGEGKWYNDP
jgi:hypothetical protein